MHGKDGCVEDVDVVDLFVCCPSHTPCQGVALYDRPELLALMLGEFLGVVEQGIGVAIGKYNRSSAHRTCEAAAPGFVASGFEDECRGGCREDFGWAFHFALCLTLHRQNRIRDPTC